MGTVEKLITLNEQHLCKVKHQAGFGVPGLYKFQPKANKSLSES